VRSEPAVPRHGGPRVERHVVSEADNELIFELVDDDDVDGGFRSSSPSSSGDEAQHPLPEQNPSATSQLLV